MSISTISRAFAAPTFGSLDAAAGHSNMFGQFAHELKQLLQGLLGWRVEDAVARANSRKRETLEVLCSILSFQGIPQDSPATVHASSIGGYEIQLDINGLHILDTLTASGETLLDFRNADADHPPHVRFQELQDSISLLLASMTPGQYAEFSCGDPDGSDQAMPLRCLAARCEFAANLAFYQPCRDYAANLSLETALGQLGSAEFNSFGISGLDAPALATACSPDDRAYLLRMLQAMRTFRERPARLIPRLLSITATHLGTPDFSGNQRTVSATVRTICEACLDVLSEEDSERGAASIRGQQAVLRQMVGSAGRELLKTVDARAFASLLGVSDQGERYPEMEEDEKVLAAELIGAYLRNPRQEDESPTSYPKRIARTFVGELYRVYRPGRENEPAVTLITEVVPDQEKVQLLECLAHGPLVEYGTVFQWVGYKENGSGEVQFRLVHPIIELLTRTYFTILAGDMDQRRSGQSKLEPGKGGVQRKIAPNIMNPEEFANIEETGPRFLSEVNKSALQYLEKKPHIDSVLKLFYEGHGGSLRIVTPVDRNQLLPH